MKQEAIAAVHDGRTPWAAWAMTMGFALLAGCAGSLKMHYADVGQVVRARTGQNVEWPVSPSLEAAACSAIAPTLERPLTAEDAVRVALANNRALRATLNEIGLARADLIQATLPANPQVFSRYRRQTTGNDIYNYELRPSEDFMEIIVLPLRRRAARHRLERTKAQVAGAALDLAGQTRIAFYTLQGDLQGRDQRRRVVETLTAEVDLARRKRLAGDVTENALLGRDAALAKTRLELAGAELRVTADREQLNRLMGLSGAPADTWRVAGELPPPPAREPPLEDLEAQALERHMDLASAREEGAALRQVLYLQQMTRWVPYWTWVSTTNATPIRPGSSGRR